jgi:hypothetical protein
MPLSDRGVVAALGQGRSRQCPQTAGTTSPYAEECLVANVFTPYLPGSSVPVALKPIMVWLHGGGVRRALRRAMAATDCRPPVLSSPLAPVSTLRSTEARCRAVRTSCWSLCVLIRALQLADY